MLDIYTIVYIHIHMTKKMKKLTAQIDLFLIETKMGSSYFGKLAAGNSELVKRLRNGREILPRTELRVRKFMRLYRRNRKDAA